MFYSAELLSHKNKTSLSLLYYLFTTGSLKRINRKEILDLNFNKVLDEITNPEIPFALRLYSYLLKGIVKAWLLKIDFYKSRIKKIIADRHLNLPSKKTNTKKSKIKNVNLVINEDVISEIEDSNTSSHLNFYNKSFMPDIDMGYIEGLRNSETIQSFDNFDFYLENPINTRTSVQKGLKIDLKTILENNIIKNKTESNKILMPELEKCFIINEFSKIWETRVFFNKNSGFDLDIDNISVEDPRISSSISQEREFKKHRVLCDEYYETNSEAFDFYNVLVRASKGEIKPYQIMPFGEILYE